MTGRWLALLLKDDLVDVLWAMLIAEDKKRIGFVRPTKAAATSIGTLHAAFGIDRVYAPLWRDRHQRSFFIMILGHETLDQHLSEKEMVVHRGGGLRGDERG